MANEQYTQEGVVEVSPGAFLVMSRKALELYGRDVANLEFVEAWRLVSQIIDQYPVDEGLIIDRNKSDRVVLDAHDDGLEAFRYAANNSLSEQAPSNVIGRDLTIHLLGSKRVWHTILRKQPPHQKNLLF